ncbi:MAG: CHAT domain-containing protein, partial [Acidobacteriota bacterium]
GERPFAGVATALVRGGVAGVLAMQDPIPDRLAIALGRVLYHRLADGDPVEAALAEARLELHADGPSHPEAWATPVLYQRTPKILAVPPKIGPTLERWWTRAAVLHLLFVGVMLLRERSTFPPLDRAMSSQVAGFFGVLFGLPIFVLSLYYLSRYIELVRLPDRESLSLPRRFAERFPVAFRAVVQGRRQLETVYQIASLLVFVVGPMVMQGYLMARTLEAPIWLRKDKVIVIEGWRQQLFDVVPLGSAFIGDRYRIGWLDDRPCIAEVIDTMTYSPFWGSWGLLIAEISVAIWVLVILRRATVPHVPKQTLS